MRKFDKAVISSDGRTGRLYLVNEQGETYSIGLSHDQGRVIDLIWELVYKPAECIIETMDQWIGSLEDTQKIKLSDLDKAA